MNNYTPNTSNPFKLSVHSVHSEHSKHSVHSKRVKHFEPLGHFCKPKEIDPNVLQCMGRWVKSNESNRSNSSNSSNTPNTRIARIARMDRNTRGSNIGRNGGDR